MTDSSGSKRKRATTAAADDHPRPRAATKMWERLLLSGLTMSERMILHRGDIDNMLELDESYYQCAVRKLCIMGFIQDAADIGEVSVSYFYNVFFPKIRENNTILCDAMMFIPPWHKLTVFLINELKRIQSYRLPIPHPKTYYNSIAANWKRCFPTPFVNIFNVIDYKFEWWQLPQHE
jgi:hypothetical protein